MDRLIFIAMSGARETMAAQAENSNNLANASTTGFRADFQSSLSQPVYGPGEASRVYATNQGGGVDFSQGSIVTTGRDLDMSIQGQGWFAVQDANGNEAYTRAGDVRLDNLGRLTTGAGNILLGNGGPISLPPHSKLDIGGDGTISIQPQGQPASTLAVIDRIKMVNPPLDQLFKGEDGLIRVADGIIAEADAGVSVVSGSLESSNVNAVASMVRMIELARQYETHIKLISTAEKNDEAAASMIRMS